MAASIIPVMVSTKRLEGTLVAPQRKQRVPDHLSETRFFGRTKKNDMLHINPSVVYFDGYKVDKVHKHTLQIINSSKNNQHMHIIPPTTSAFTIKYTKKESGLIPGMNLSVMIEFKPNKWQYYYDCIRIHCAGEQNILVPIHAYPVMNTDHFPRSVTFAPIPVGQNQTKTISLKCDIPVDFEFRLSYDKLHPSFTVDKMKGVVPGEGKATFTVTFAPTDFSTAVMKLKLELSQYNFNPVICTFTGNSAPGLACQQKNLPTSSVQPPLAAKCNLMELSRQVGKRLKSTTTKSKVSRRNVTPPKKDQDIVFEGYHFPVNLQAHSAVGAILRQQPGKIKASQLRKVTSHLSITESVIFRAEESRQVKEATFLQAVQQKLAEARTQELRWVDHFGENPMTPQEKDKVYEQRKKAVAAYEHVVVPENEYTRTQTLVRYHKTQRKVDEHLAHLHPTFDLYLNNGWLRRHLALRKFVQAGRKVIVQLRCQARLSKIKRLVSDLKAGKSARQSIANVYGTNSPSVSVTAILPSSPNHILPFSFPKYKGHTSSSVVAEPQEENLDDKPVEMKTVSITDIKKEVPYLDLKVPQQSEILGYRPVPLPEISSFISPVSRPLLTGAEDEFQSLGLIPGVDLSFLTSAELPQPLSEVEGLPPQESIIFKTTPSKILPITSSATQHALTLSSSSSSDSPPLSIVTGTKTGQTSTAVETSETTEITTSGIPTEQEVDGTEVEEEDNGVPLILPSALLKPPDLNPYHLLNPTPNLTSYYPMLPYSEATLDHVLLPLPTYPNAKHPQVKFDPIDIIPGVMNWKTFPSPCLTAFQSDMKLISLWKPNLSNPFSSDLLPNSQQNQALMTGVQHDDIVDIKNTEVLPVPTMDMIKAQFFIPVIEEELPGINAGGSMTAEQMTIKQHPGVNPLTEAKNELERYKADQFNKLGHRIKEKIPNLVKYLSLDDSQEDNTQTITSHLTVKLN